VLYKDINSWIPAYDMQGLAGMRTLAGGKDNNKGILHLAWRKSAFKRARFVRFYNIQRRQVESNGDGQIPVGPWCHVTSAIDNKLALKTEPAGLRLEYRVRAVNKGGESSPSNTISVIL
jgi:hypothetical protein